MSRKGEAKVNQDEPTRPRPVDGNGRQLDAHGLPLGGPARVAALAKIGKPDPFEDPQAWGEPAPAAAPIEGEQ